MTSPVINPFDPQFNADPFSQYERLRAQGPVYRSHLGIWFVGRYDDVRAVLKDPRLRVPDMVGLLHRKNQLLKTRVRGGRCEFGLEHLTECARHWLPFIEGPPT